jgi:hypothetical protein
MYTKQNVLNVVIDNVEKICSSFQGASITLIARKNGVVKRSGDLSVSPKEAAKKAVFYFKKGYSIDVEVESRREDHVFIAGQFSKLTTSPRSIKSGTIPSLVIKMSQSYFVVWTVDVENNATNKKWLSGLDTMPESNLSSIGSKITFPMLDENSPLSKICYSNETVTNIYSFINLQGLNVWLNPKAIRESYASAKFPIEALPSFFKKITLDLTRHFECPIDYVIAPLLCITGGLIGHKLHVHHIGNNDFIIPPNLWGMGIGESGTGKSPVFDCIRNVITPLTDRAEGKFKTDVQLDKAKKIVKKELDSIEIKGIREQLRMANEISDEDGREREIERITKGLSESFDIECKPVLKRLFTNKATYAALHKMLSENPDGIILLLDELNSLLKLLARPANAEYRAFSLECFNGFGQYDNDRMHNSTTAKNMLLSIYGTIQPSVLLPYQRATLEGTSQDDGYLNRFQIIVNPRPIKRSGIVQEPLDPKLQSDLKAFFELAGFDNFGFDETVELKQRAVPFSNGAEEIFLSWWKDITKSCEDKSLPEPLRRYLRKYQTFLPKLALILQVVSSFDSTKEELKTTTQVGKAATLSAVKLARYFESHARYLFAPNRNIVAEDAEIIMTRLDRLGAEFTVRDIMQKNWKNLPRKNETTKVKVINALEFLEKLHVVRRVVGSLRKWEQNPKLN